MEIFRGSLDDIARPASSELSGSRVSSVSLPYNDRISPTSPFSLIVLTNNSDDVQNSFEETSSSSVRDPVQDVTEEDNDDSKLQRAIEEMRRLDEILSAKVLKGKERRRQRKELQAKLWKELLQNKPEGHPECLHEALNTRLFLALDTPAGTAEEDNFTPVFQTQVSECDRDGQKQELEQDEKRPDSLTEAFEAVYEDTGEDLFKGSHCGASRGMNKQKDFVRRNIELVSAEGGQVLLTQAEKERLAELLRDIDEEEEESAGGADSEETMWAVPVLTGQGYTPEPSDLQQLIDIDSKIGLILPGEEIYSVQSSYTNMCTFQGPGSEIGWKCDGDPQPGEKVLQDIMERRGQERRLREIQQQLESLGQGQEMTNVSPCLTEEELHSLLDECDLTESWNQDLETSDTIP
ncbi:fibrous sheath-interacting protein 1 [Parambassis ranga]|uniref:Fibrous sheath-interacting protein 1 n=1 Tax=Parambassis ranga TaxID=210632 RepID=A0A6P7HMU2_9TELE|nr:fibrous sheath-interacting protein 1 [Parambassis ranga]